MDINSFLDLVVYYRRIVEGFSFISSLLTNLTQKKEKFSWTDESKKSFQTLKDWLTLALILTLKEGNDGFFVYHDTSLIWLGCVLKQHGKVISYDSR